MKKTILLIFLSILLFSCKENLSQKNKIDKKTLDKKIDLVINNWHKAASNANYENYFNKMDSVSVFIGTDASENWNKKEFSSFSKPYFDKGKSWDFKPLERNIYNPLCIMI